MWDALLDLQPLGPVNGKFLHSAAPRLRSRCRQNPGMALLLAGALSVAVLAFGGCVIDTADVGQSSVALDMDDTVVPESETTAARDELDSLTRSS